ncbi:helix-turn-helix transcriptional regulator [Deinococcus phoenicis]|nr:helix-turn-helix transcriptional regulator [Deinococcus phoenicis]
MAKTQEKKTLAQWREERGITVQTLADGLGISRGSMGDYLHGRKEPSITRALLLAELLKVDVHQVDWKTKPQNERLVSKSAASSPS